MMKGLVKFRVHSFQLLGITLPLFFLTACNSVMPTVASATITPLPPGVGRIAFYSDGIYFINSDGTNLTNVTHSDVYDIAWSPDGHYIAFVNNEVFTIAVNGGKPIQLTKLLDTLPLRSPAWSWDGHQIAFASYTGSSHGKLYAIKVEETIQNTSNNAPTVLRNDIDAQGLTWSSDDQYIAFAYRDDLHSQSAIAVINNKRRQWTHLSLGTAPAWSPQGRRLTFASERDSNVEIYLFDSVEDTSHPMRLTNTADNGSATWSPDGKQIVFISNRNGNYEIYMMDADGNNQTRLTNNSAIDFLPTWSPDGQQIAFVSKRDGNQEIYVMNADGSNQTRLTNTPEDEWNPVWQPQ